MRLRSGRRHRLNDASYSFPGWFSGEEIIDRDDDHSCADCQTLCAAYHGRCDYFSANGSCSGTARYVHECYMKQAHEEDVTIYPDTCHGFVKWGLGDTDVAHSASGNAVAPTRLRRMACSCPM